MKLVHKDTKRGRGSGNPTYKKKGIYPAVPCVVLITLRFFLTQNINNNCNIPIKDQLKLTLLSSGQSFFLNFFHTGLQLPHHSSNSGSSITRSYIYALC